MEIGGFYICLSQNFIRFFHIIVGITDGGKYEFLNYNQAPR